MQTMIINPEALGAPSGYSNGILVEPGGKLLFIAGQIGWNAEQQIVSGDFVAQFDQARGTSQNIVRLTIYVTDKNEYATRRQEIGERYRKLMGKHFPAMVLV